MKRVARIASRACGAALAGLFLASSANAQPPRRGAPPPPPATRPAADEPAAGDEASERTTKTQDIALAVGETRTFPATDVANYSEGTPGIIDVKLTSDASKFVVVGLKPGSTSLLLIGRDGKQTNVVLNVFARSPEQVASEVSQLIEGYTGVRVRRVGSRFFIEGGVSNEVDLKRIEQLAKLYPGQVESLVGVGAGAADRNTNIRIDVYFVQYEKNSSYNVGVNWPTLVGGAVLQSNIGYDFISKTPTAQASAVNQPLPGLDIAATHGWAKVLKQATVITTNGVEAKLTNGGEQNFSVANGLTSTIKPITFGTTVTVVPRFDPQTRDLEVKVDADVSDLVPSVSGTSLPGRQLANLTTLVHLKLGQSLVLSGIHTFAQSHSVTGIPLLSQIPVLGVLFGGHSDSDTETEGAVFIIPSVVEANDKSALAVVDEAMAQYERFSGGMKRVHSFDHYPPVNTRPAHLAINAVAPAAASNASNPQVRQGGTR
jgi:pilus assembly protein CpaC